MDNSAGNTHRALASAKALSGRFFGNLLIVRKAPEVAWMHDSFTLTVHGNYAGETGFSVKLAAMITEPQTDEALMLLYCDGDLLAFKELYQRHRLGLYRFIDWRSPRQEWVDEIVQDSWAALHAARSQYTALASFKTYLYQIARNRLIDILRQRESLLDADPDQYEHTLESTQESTPLTRSPETRLEKKQQTERLHEAIRSLPSEQKEALVLQQFNGLSLEEIATITAVSTETVKSRLRYAMQKLRAELHTQTQGEPA
ncbi:sigma-70 family RNA polymerase sigma factor [Undibacterium sp. TC9W]|uniref:sigma-70 family RNA polymerase sigma factor n=1 Tax=Undibacterium sp. TC9W TaxID=3413053 RepID=UPI003BF41339